MQQNNSKFRRDFPYKEIPDQIYYCSVIVLPVFCQWQIQSNLPYILPYGKIVSCRHVSLSSQVLPKFLKIKVEAQFELWFKGVDNVISIEPSRSQIARQMTACHTSNHSLVVHRSADTVNIAQTLPFHFNPRGRSEAQYDSR